MAVTRKSKAGGKKAEAGSEAWARQNVIESALAMSRSGLSPGRSGNVSCRWTRPAAGADAIAAAAHESAAAEGRATAGMLITPSGMAYEDLLAEDIVFVAADGGLEPDARKPSSEWRFHLAAYGARADRHAIVHTHSLHATVLACAHHPIPAFHYMVAAAGGSDIPLVPYATFGTEELSRHVASGLKDRDACLMANHGQIALGRTLAGALELAQEVEVLAEQYMKVLQLGAVHVLDAAEMRKVLQRFKSYGQRAQA